jgi:hypothetical protein
MPYRNDSGWRCMSNVTSGIGRWYVCPTVNHGNRVTSVTQAKGLQCDTAPYTARVHLAGMAIHVLSLSGRFGVPEPLGSRGRLIGCGYRAVMQWNDDDTSNAQPDETRHPTLASGAGLTLYNSLIMHFCTRLLSLNRQCDSTP